MLNNEKAHHASHDSGFLFQSPYASKLPTGLEISNLDLIKDMERIIGIEEELSPVLE